jgi:hypothetical protein
MACRGICHRFEVKTRFGGRSYVNGQKRCQVCEIYLKVEGYVCPCCKLRLRLKPKQSKWKEGYKTLELNK